MTSRFRTFLLMALLSGLVLLLGRAIGGSGGLLIALIIALVMNVGSYWFSSSIVLKMYRARELGPDEAPMLHSMVKELAHNAGIPMPKICIVPDPSPNAFATGRNPENGVVAVTDGIMRLLSPEELRGVLAHEITHIANRDILVQTIAAVMGTVVVYLAHMAQIAAIFGGRREDGSGGSALGGLLMAILAPIAASLIQFAISRSREYMADEGGAHISGTPLALASALEKLSSWSKQIPMREQNPTTENMFIVSPLAGGGISSLFSTHPPIAERVARLRSMQAGR